MLNILSIIFGAVAILALGLGFLPLLGWLNWFLTLPIALIGLVLGVIAPENGGRNLNLVVIGLAALRLLLGGGVL